MKRPAEVAHGPMFIGFFANVLLYGIMITQLYIYFNNYKKDRLWIKLFVVLLFLCDTVNTVFDAVYLYNSLIIHFADVEYLGNANWVFATDPAMTAIIAILVQGFFAWRIKVLTGNLWLVALVVSCSMTGLAGGVVTAFEVGRTPQFVNFRDFKVSTHLLSYRLKYSHEASIVGSHHVVGWSMLRGHLDHHHSGLAPRKHKTGIQSSDDLVDRVIRLTVQTGLVTSICAIVDLILFLTDPTGTHLIFNFPLSKLYTNSLMSSLNSRGVWSFNPRRRSQSGMSGTNPSTNVSTSTNVHSQKGSFKMHEIPSDTRSQVFVHVESHELRDLEMIPSRPQTGNRMYSMPDEEKSFDTGRLEGVPKTALEIKQERDDRVPFESYRSGEATTM